MHRNSPNRNNTNNHRFFVAEFELASEINLSHQAFEQNEVKSAKKLSDQT